MEPPTNQSEIADPEISYYRGDSFALSWTEIWRLCPSFIHFILFVVIRLLRIKMANEFAIAVPCQLNILDYNFLTDEALKTINAADTEWKALGFDRSVLYSFEILGREEIYAASYLCADQKTVLGTTMYYRIVYQNVETLRVVHSVRSEDSDGQVHSHLGSKQELECPGQFHRHYLKSEPISELLAAQKKLVANRTDWRLFHDGNVQERIRAWNNIESRFQIERGFYVLVDQVMVDKLRKEREQACCLRCGDFAGDLTNIDHPGYCQACHPFAPTDKNNHHAIARRNGRIFTSGIISFLVVIFLIFQYYYAKGFVTMPDVAKSLIVALLFFLLMLLLSRLLEKFFGRRKRRI
jgi:hypothetical protein